MPCVRQLLDEGSDLGPLTVLVGENGSGKSTLVEAVAMRYGLSPEGGSTGARHSTRETESPLVSAIELRRGIGASRWGFFLRAETMHGFYTYLEQPATVHAVGDPCAHEMSHGESFVHLLQERFERSRASTCSTSRSPRCRSPAASPWSTCSPASRPTACARPSSPRTRRSWPRRPARASSRSASGACASAPGRTSSSCRTGVPSSTRPTSSSGTWAADQLDRVQLNAIPGVSRG